MATIALVLALGSTAVAAATITGRNIKNGSVTGADLKANSVPGGDLRNSTLTGADVKDGTLTGRDVKDGSLGGRDVGEGSLASGDLSAAARKALLPDFAIVRNDTPGSLTGAYVDQVSASLIDQPAGAQFVVRASIRLTAGGAAPMIARCRIHVDGAASPEVSGENDWNILVTSYETVPVVGTTGALTAGAHSVSLACRNDVGLVDMVRAQLELQPWSGTWVNMIL